MIIKMITSFFIFILIALTTQNAVFVNGFGLSEAIRLVKDTKKNRTYFAIALIVFQTLSMLLVYAITPLFANDILTHYYYFALPTLIILCCLVSYLLVVIVAGLILPVNDFKNIIFSVTGASVNSAIVGTILLCVYQTLTLPQALGFGLGSSIGYFLAILLLKECNRKIKHDLVPENFKGLPIKLIYISIVALSIYGIAGNNII